MRTQTFLSLAQFRRERFAEIRGFEYRADFNFLAVIEGYAGEEIVEELAMNAPTVPINRTPNTARRAILAILAGGLIAGTIDICAAALINHISLPVICRAVASGLLGKVAFDGGLSVSALGLLLQWGMSLMIAAIFVLAALQLTWLTARPILAGLTYGAIVFLVMNYVVMPLSAVGHSPHFTPVSFALNFAAMLLFGLIVAFITRRTLRVT